MEDYKWLVYIAIFIAFIVRTFFKKKNKENGQEGNEETSSSESIQSVLEEIIGTKSPEPVYSDVQESEPHVEEEIQPAYSDQEQIREELQKVIASEGDSSGRQRLERQEKLHRQSNAEIWAPQDEENGFEFDARKAVIYSEILNRKYS